MINIECAEQLNHLVAIKNQLVHQLQRENMKLKEEQAKNDTKAVTHFLQEINSRDLEIEKKQHDIDERDKQITQQQQEIDKRDQVIYIKQQEIYNKEQEIIKKEQQIATLTDKLNEIQQKYLSEVEGSSQFIDQLGKDIEKKDKLMLEEYVLKSRYEEMVGDNKKKREQIRRLEQLLFEAQEDAAQSRDLLEIKAKEYNSSFTKLKEATLGQLETFEAAYEQASSLQAEVTRLKQLLEQKEKEAKHAQQQAQAIEKSMAQIKVKYEQELYITKQMLKTEAARKRR
eukprot:Phypoly_transcript_12991.p1 GENE.Phypoly_transcript_12991~~Phypoly_transcript_12991.p1  ORF type:complete len:285 (+),score=68.49 Phypoly_transcript_12991:188-1042(+)